MEIAAVVEGASVLEFERSRRARLREQESEAKNET